MPVGLETVKFTVDGKQYKTTLLGARQGRSLYLRIVKTVAPALEKLDLKALREGETEQAMLVSAAAALGAIEGALLDDLCEAFGAVTSVQEAQGEITLDPLQFDMHFAKRYSSMVRWLAKCCEVNGFFDFLSAIPGLVAAPASQSVSKPQTG